MTRRPEKVAQAVAREIVNEIVTSSLPIGTVLSPEAEMATSFGVSRQSLREALRVLEVLGLISIRTGPGGGPVTEQVSARNFGEVTSLYYQMTGTTFQELVEVRLALEPFTAGLAAQRRSEQEAARLQAMIDGSQNALDDGAFRRAGQDFHQVVASASGNRAIELLVHSCTEVFHGRVNTVVYPSRQRRGVISVHNQIAEAIIKQDAPLADQLMRQHMENYIGNLQSRFRHMMAEVVQW